MLLSRLLCLGPVLTKARTWSDRPQRPLFCRRPPLKSQKKKRIKLGAFSPFALLFFLLTLKAHCSWRSALSHEKKRQRFIQIFKKRKGGEIFILTWTEAIKTVASSWTAIRRGGGKKYTFFCFKKWKTISLPPQSELGPPLFCQRETGKGKLSFLYNSPLLLYFLRLDIPCV